MVKKKSVGWGAGGGGGLSRLHFDFVFGNISFPRKREKVCLQEIFARGIWAEGPVFLEAG